MGTVPLPEDWYLERGWSLRARINRLIVTAVNMINVDGQRCPSTSGACILIEAWEHIGRMVDRAHDCAKDMRALQDAVESGVVDRGTLLARVAAMDQALHSVETRHKVLEELLRGDKARKAGLCV